MITYGIRAEVGIETPFSLLSWSIVKKSIVIFLICCPLLIFLPNKKEFAMIYVIPKITNSEIAKQMPDDLIEIYEEGVKTLKSSIAGEIKEKTK